MELHNYNTYSSTYNSNTKRKYYLAFNRHGEPRRLQIPSSRTLGKLATYTNAITETVPQERVEQVIARNFGANRIKHGIRQLCDTGKPLNKLIDNKHFKARPKCNANMNLLNLKLNLNLNVNLSVNVNLNINNTVNNHNQTVSNSKLSSVTLDSSKAELIPSSHSNNNSYSTIANIGRDNSAYITHKHSISLFSTNSSKGVNNQLFYNVPAANDTIRTQIYTKNNTNNCNIYTNTSTNVNRTESKCRTINKDFYNNNTDSNSNSSNNNSNSSIDRYSNNSSTSPIVINNKVILNNRNWSNANMTDINKTKHRNSYISTVNGDGYNFTIAHVLSNLPNDKLEQTHIGLKKKRRRRKCRHFEEDKDNNCHYETSPQALRKPGLGQSEVLGPKREQKCQNLLREQQLANLAKIVLPAMCSKMSILWKSDIGINQKQLLPQIRQKQPRRLRHQKQTHSFGQRLTDVDNSRKRNQKYVKHMQENHNEFNHRKKKLRNHSVDINTSTVKSIAVNTILNETIDRSRIKNEMPEIILADNDRNRSNDTTFNNITLKNDNTALTENNDTADMISMKKSEVAGLESIELLNDEINFEDVEGNSKNASYSDEQFSAENRTAFWSAYGDLRPLEQSYV